MMADCWRESALQLIRRTAVRKQKKAPRPEVERLDGFDLRIKDSETDPFIPK
jgi:hypothetical protein